MVPDSELRKRFTYHPPDNDRVLQHRKIRDYCLELALVINNTVPDGREKEESLTFLDEVAMWANAAIARRSD